MNENIEKITGK
jgi:hypothetical protein